LGETGYAFSGSTSMAVSEADRREVTGEVGRGDSMEGSLEASDIGVRWGLS
jgi:hypothetical protein